MLFSVVIPAYHAERFIQRSICSVLNQTFSDFEVIVINDGSKDGTSQKAREMTDERVRVIDQENGGVSVARNTGILNAKGDYICFLDADDEFLPDHLSILAEAIGEYVERGFFATRFCLSMIEDNDKVVSPEVSGKTVFYENVVEVLFQNSELIWTGCVCIRRDMFDRYGMFEPGVKLGEDTDMWRRVYLREGAVCVDRVTVKRNRDGSEATRQYTRSFQADPLNRMPHYFADDSILPQVKESLRTEWEWTKLQVVRSHLFVGEKKIARIKWKEIDFRRIPWKRRMITMLCFCIPSALIRAAIRWKNRGLYE